MFVLGHIGIGRTLLGPSRWKIPAAAFVAGALLPDIVDKSLYYSHLTRYATSTRTFGHTGLFLCAIAAIVALRRSRAWGAVAIGVATHLALDGLVDLFTPEPSSAWIALTWPFLHARFAAAYFRTPLDQLGELATPAILISEIAGGLLLVRDYRISRRRAALPEHPEPRPDRAGSVGTVPVVERDE